MTTDNQTPAPAENPAPKPTPFADHVEKPKGQKPGIINPQHSQGAPRIKVIQAGAEE